MESPKAIPVVGVFEDHAHADAALCELLDAGFRNDQIGVAMRQIGSNAKLEDQPETHANAGAITGTLTGLGVGALAGLGILTGLIPAVGPAIAAGTLGVLLSNVAAGAGIAGVVGALIGAGIPREQAEDYEREFQAGHTIVTVHAGDRHDQAATILRRHGARRVTDQQALAVGNLR